MQHYTISIQFLTFLAVPSQVMKRGSHNTTLKPSGEVNNGKLPIPHDHKWSVSPNQESKECCWLFWYYRDCSLWICTNWTNSQPSLLFGSTGKLREKLVGNNPNFCQQLMDLALWQWTFSHGTVREGVFSY